MSLKISCDDGCASDTRLASLALKWDIPVTFYLPVEWHSLAHDKGYVPLDYEKAVDISKQFEIGSHAITHRHLTKIPLDEAFIEIAESQQILREMFDQEITKFCPPRGYTNEALTKFTKSLYKSQRLTKGPGLVHVHPDSGGNNNFPWRQYAVKNKVKELWCHSWELDKYNLWGELEEYLAAYTKLRTD